MRILLAVDGSPAAATAMELVRATPWENPTIVRTVIVDESRANLEAAPWLGEPLVERTVPSAHLTQDLFAIVREAQERLLDAGLPTTAVELRGRAATEIVAEAGRWQADMIVIGSRGHGLIERMLLGSVSAEVVDRAPCPVLVARTSSVEHAIVAVDGSECSDRAVSFVAAHALFPAARLTALSVAPPRVVAEGGPMAIGMAELGVEASEEAVQWHSEFADRAADDLQRAGRVAEARVATGSAPGAILEAARSADLIVVGTRGNTGLRRLLLGSTARNVLLHAHASVLVVRQPRRRVAVEERLGRRAAVGVAAGAMTLA
jgi:nucleotide-binding universal stress UspA family protein